MVFFHINPYNVLLKGKKNCSTLLFSITTSLTLTRYPYSRYGFFPRFRWYGQVVRRRPAKPLFPSSNLGATFFKSFKSIKVKLLYLIPTPIGHLDDMTYRAVDSLKKADCVLCEDTRRSVQLLNHYGIKKKLISYHKFNEKAQEETIIEKLRQQQTIALISDAGTPGICDPGARLVWRCIQEDLEYDILPGSSAILPGLIHSGFDIDFFQFCGFVPQKSKERALFFHQLLDYSGVSVAFDTPQHLPHTLKDLKGYVPCRSMIVAKELTKQFQTIFRGTPTTLLQDMPTWVLKGEIVLVIDKKQQERSVVFSDPLEYALFIEKTFNLPYKEAVKIVCSVEKIDKQIFYERKNR